MKRAIISGLLAALSCFAMIGWMGLAFYVARILFPDMAALMGMTLTIAGIIGVASGISSYFNQKTKGT